MNTCFFPAKANQNLVKKIIIIKTSSQSTFGEKHLISGSSKKIPVENLPTSGPKTVDFKTQVF